MTVVAAQEAPPIICPPWCVVTREEHLSEIRDLDEVVVHWSSERPAGESCNVRIASTTHLDGTPDPTDPTHLFIEDDHFADGAELDTARQFGEGIIAAVREARSSLAPPPRPAADGCPAWCTFDHAGPVHIHAGGHARLLAGDRDDLVEVVTTDDAPAELHVWLGGNVAYEMPWRPETAGELRSIAEMISRAADELEQATA